MKAVITNLFLKIIGKKHGYCCKDCVTNLYSVLDGEATKAEEEHFKSHINKCSPCFNRYEIDKSVKEVLKLKVEQKEVPASLIDSIKSKINKPA